MRDGSAMKQLTWQDLSSPGATLAAGVSSGSVAGLLIGGVGGRLAMFVLRLTSDPALRGAKTDDGFTTAIWMRVATLASEGTSISSDEYKSLIEGLKRSVEEVAAVSRDRLSALDAEK
jgi:hypothetical protein